MKNKIKNQEIVKNNLSQREILKELTKKNAFDTLCWQESNEKDKEHFVKLIKENFSEEIINNILKSSRSQRDSSYFISLDSGEIYLYLKQKLKTKCLHNIDLEAIQKCEHLIVFFKTKTPLKYEKFSDKLKKFDDQDKFKCWTFCTIPSKEESIDVILFKEYIQEKQK
jgi:hypothetical protein